jgi:GTP diphosphokinase / guanosine-3',5'-bis(diphosphate) 3'-diphosphatase
VEVEWDRKKKVPHTAHIRIHSVDQKGVLAAVTNAVSACEANIVSANVQTSPDQKGVIVFAVSVEDVQHLNRVINALLKVKGVQRVERLRH